MEAEVVQKPNETEMFLRKVNKIYLSLPATIRHVIDKFRDRVNSEKNITTTIENIRQENLTSFATDDEPTMKNREESSDLPGEQTI
jgi:hypothetical protein